MSFKDHFSGHAGSYARYRPDYPAELFDYLASIVPRREVALDCATGSGQAALGLARRFDRVIASDASVSQLRNARQHPRVAYVAHTAEQAALRDRSVDLVVAAQAAHWFDHERFHREVRRVLRPHGALAIWTYGLAVVSPAIDAVVKRFYSDVVGPYWPPERRYIESAYRELPFPWREIAAPGFRLNLQWDLDSFIGYIGTWSAVQRYTKTTGADPLPVLRAQMADEWAAGQGVARQRNLQTVARSVVWPLHLRVGAS